MPGKLTPEKTKIQTSIPIQTHSTANLVIWALSLSRPYKKWVIIILISMLVETVMSLASPWPLKIIIDNVIGHKELPHWLKWLDYLVTHESKIQLAAIVAIVFVIITVVGAIAGYLDSYFNESVAQYVANDLRQKLYHHLQRLSLTYYDTHESSKLLSTITADVSTIQDFASSTLLTIVVDFLTIFGIFILMFYLHPGFTILALAVTPLMLLFVSRFKKTIKKATREVRRDQSNMFTVIQNGLESIRSVNAFGRQNLEEEKLQKASHATIDASLKARRIKSALSPVVTIMVAVCTSLVIWRGADLVLTNVMTVGTLTVFLWYMNKFFSPIQDLAKMTSNVAQATVALERIQSILDTDIITPEKINAKDAGKLSGNIIFENVAFSYNPEVVLLRDINLKINCGERIGICGPTGCGKSTIVSLIARFYDVNSGKIFIDDNDITNLKLDGLRSQIGYVLQDTFLFYGTVRDNIAYGRPDATDEEIIEAAKLAYAHEFILKMPLGYDTLVGERGTTLSGGQRQRIGIARAVVRNSPILILDEPTAALDSDSEKIVMAALENLMLGRTVITITHRLSTIRHADQIFVFNNGFIAEQGTHDMLMEKNQLYANLYTNQTTPDHSYDHAMAEKIID